MHQIYSCSDENIEVFTTVIPSKVTSPARRRVKSSQHLLSKNVVIESDLYTPRPLELLPHRGDRWDAGEARRFGRLQNTRPPGAHPAKTSARPGNRPRPPPPHQGLQALQITGISESKASHVCGSRAYGKSLIPPVPRISVKAPAVPAVEAAGTGSENRAVLTRGSRHLKKMAEEYPTLPQGAEASLPLTGSASCGVPSILRKMWTRHKKKSEYVGATNSAFEAD